MTADWSNGLIYLVVLVAAAAHALWNLLLKRSEDRLITLAGLRLVGVVCSLFLLQVYPFPPPEAYGYLAAHGAFTWAYYYFLLRAYAAGEFGNVYPIARGLAPLVVLLAAAIVGTDVISGGQWLGVVLVCLGLFGFATGALSDVRATAYAVATGLTIGGYSFMAGLGVRASASPLGYLAASELVAAAGLLPFVFVRRGRLLFPQLSLNWPIILGAGLLSLGGFGVLMWAFTQLPLGPITAVRETSIAFALLFAWWLLGERIRAQQLWAGLLVVLGIVTLVLN